MLQRAASNAYSWWWASHIRTKQSKWLEQNLQDMEEKVEVMLKLIEEDGDSFAKRAEMYYKKRPELINFVEESFRAYRALAERYDHISTELQNANNTIATVFPERVQFEMDEDDEHRSPRINKFPQAPKPNIPKIPKLPNRDLKGLLTSATTKLQVKKALKTASTDSAVAKSGLNKSEAVEEIDKLQKGILALQTEKEYVKSSYEHGLAKYWEIEKHINEMHERICSLQDEFSVSRVIEDDEARTLMAASALRSCQESLAHLQDEQERSAEEARIENERIKNARNKLHSLRNELLPNQVEQEKPYEKHEPTNEEEIFKNLDQEQGVATQGRQQLEALREKIKEYFEVGSNAALSVTEMAEKIDELVNMVISLETAVLSQTALIKSLRTEADELQAQISSLEDDKAALCNGSNGVSSKLRQMEEKLQGIQDLNQNVEDQNNNLQTHFTQAHCSLDQLTEKLHSLKPDEELEAAVLSNKEDGYLPEVKSQKEPKEQDNPPDPDDSLEKVHHAKLNETVEVTGSLQKEEKGQKDPPSHGDGSEKAWNVQVEVREDSKDQDVGISVKNQEEEEEKASQLKANKDPDSLSQKSENLTPEDEIDKQDSSQRDDDLNEDAREHGAEHEDEPNWRLLFLNGLEDREKILLSEYTTILRNYKEVKKQLGEVEKKNRDSLIEKTVQLKQLRNANGMKDEEIQSLRQKLSFLVTTLDDNPDLKELKDSYHHPTLNLLDGQDIEPTTRSEESTATESRNNSRTDKEDGEDTNVIVTDQPWATSATEEKFRMKIDEVLEENLDFWLNFSSSFHQIQKFQTGVQDLQAEVSKLEGRLKKKQDGSIVKDTSLKSDARPIYKHLREIETELTLWLEQSVLLKDELQSRFTSLCNIQEDISRALKAGCEDEAATFTSYQAAKFQGEVLNMKQENCKVGEELQAGLDHAMALQLEIQKTLTKLDEDFELSGTKNNQDSQLKHSTSRSRIPLRSFIFGVKQKKQRTSIFSSMHPALHRKQNDLRAGHMI